MGVYQKDTRSTWKNSQWPKQEKSDQKKSKVALNYYPKFEINTRKSTLIFINKNKRMNEWNVQNSK